MAVERQILQPAKTEPSNIVAAPRVPNTLSPIGEGLQDLGRAIAITSKELRQRRERAAYGNLSMTFQDEMLRLNNDVDEAALDGRSVYDRDKAVEFYEDLRNRAYESGLPSYMVTQMLNGINSGEAGTLNKINSQEFKAIRNNSINTYVGMVKNMKTVQQIIDEKSNEFNRNNLKELGFSDLDIDKILNEQLTEILWNYSYNNPEALLSVLAENTVEEDGKKRYGGILSDISINVLSSMHNVARKSFSDNKDINKTERANELASAIYEFNILPKLNNLEALFAKVGATITDEQKKKLEMFADMPRGSIGIGMLAAAGYPSELFADDIANSSIEIEDQKTILGYYKDIQKTMEFEILPEEQSNGQYTESINELMDYLSNDNIPVDKFVEKLSIAYRDGLISAAQYQSLLKEKYTNLKSFDTKFNDYYAKSQPLLYRSVLGSWTTHEQQNMFDHLMNKLNAKSAPVSIVSQLIFRLNNLIQDNLAVMKEDGTGDIVGADAMRKVFADGYRGVGNDAAVDLFIHDKASNITLDRRVALLEFINDVTQHDGIFSIPENISVNVEPNATNLDKFDAVVEFILYGSRFEGYTRQTESIGSQPEVKENEGLADRAKAWLSGKRGGEMPQK